MTGEFWRAALLFHGLLGLLTGILIRRAFMRSQARRSVWIRAMLTDVILFGTGLLAAAALAGSVAPYSFFAVARFLCQGLFAEGVLFLLSASLVAALDHRPGRAAVTLVPALMLVVAYAEAYHWGPTNLQLQRHRADRTQGGPRTGAVRILHLSDLQTHRIGTFEERVFREAAALAPDLILFTGDYIQERLAPSYDMAAERLEELQQRVPLRAPLGVYVLEGDVELRSLRRHPADDGQPAWPLLFRRSGARSLVDETVRLALPDGGTLALTGLACETSRGRIEDEVVGRVDAAPPATLHVVAGHAPEFVAHLAGRRPVDLALAGHTHGGQVVLPVLGAPLTLSRLPRRYAGGLHDYEGIPFHVSRGIGMERLVAPQIRFRCPPEICLIELRYRLPTDKKGPAAAGEQER